MSDFKSNDQHERARKLIAMAGPEALPLADQTWLATHVEGCGSCRAFAENARETIHSLRGISFAAGRSLVSETQVKVRRRALEMQRQRERVWLVAVSCIAVSVCALVSAVVLWRGFEWIGTRAELAPSIWQVGFLVFCLAPALVVGVLLLVRDSDFADRSGSYQG